MFPSVFPPTTQAASLLSLQGGTPAPSAPPLLSPCLAPSLAMSRCVPGPAQSRGASWGRSADAAEDVHAVM